MKNKTGKILRKSFLGKVPHQGAVSLNSNSRSTIYGRSRLYTHTNHQEEDKKGHTCGHAAIASILDFFDRNPWRLKRTERGQEAADDGRLHFPDILVDQIYRSYPPKDWYFLKFCSREKIIDALRDAGLVTNDSFKGAFEKSGFYIENLKIWIAKYKMPVIVLLDCHNLSPYVDGLKEGWHRYHWGIIFGFNADYVLMGSWKRVYKIPWSGFIHSWACGALPWDHQFYAIYSYVPKR